MKNILNIVLLFIASILTSGLLMLKFYSWFALPVFEGLSEITFTEAIGLSFFIGLFKTFNQPLKSEVYKEESAALRGWSLPIGYLTLLLVGWIVKLILF